MSPLAAVLTLAALVAITTVIGLVLQRRAATARRSEDDLGDVVPASDRGTAATLVQFSTEFCAQCPGVRRALTSIASERAGVTHVEIDLTHDVALAERLHILQTPTTFVLDADGTVVSRFSGATPRSAVDAELDRLPEAVHV